MQLNLNEFASNLELRDGIYFSAGGSRVSYPEEGNQSCFQFEDNSFWFSHRNKCIAAAVEKFAKGAVFFDIGGGNGFVSVGLQKSGVNAVIVEPGIQGCLNAKSRGLNHIICSTLQDAAFKPGSIEAAGMFDVVEHIEDDLAFLQTVAAYMKKDGKLFVSVPAYNWVWSNEDVIAGHYRRYTLKSISKRLEAAGFKVDYATYMFSVLPLPIFLLRSIPSKLGFAAKKLNTVKAESEHSSKRGILTRLLNIVWNWELKKFKKAKRINFGSSCFVVASKL